MYSPSERPEPLKSNTQSANPLLASSSRYNAPSKRDPELQCRYNTTGQASLRSIKSNRLHCKP